ncbi:50S ribosomal protein L13 [Candidatus Woesearchaeota archaeon]|nr:50S ribosomal protein L13 [Candidatus Woesearchaeota archaeon]
MKELIIDADKAIVGRMATFVAKQALLGRKVSVINCEKAIISGKPTQVIARYRQRRDKGTPFKGPFPSRLPDRFVRRIIRGMLPYKQGRGKEAFKNIMCYLGTPEQFKDKKTVKVDYARFEQSRLLNYVTVYDVCKALGAKV